MMFTRVRCAVDRGDGTLKIMRHAAGIAVESGRGDVVEEIVRCSRAEQAGVVVMGLRERGRGFPEPIRITERNAHVTKQACPDRAHGATRSERGVTLIC